MSGANELPSSMEFGDTYALRTFRVEDGRLMSIVHGGDHWEGGVCIATCAKTEDDPDHEVPAEGCSCGVYAFWTVEELVEQYPEQARHIVTVIRMGDATIEGDHGVKTKEAEIVAWWCSADSPEHAEACAATTPDTRRYYDRDVMVRMYPRPNQTRRGGN